MRSLCERDGRTDLHPYVMHKTHVRLYKFDELEGRTFYSQFEIIMLVVRMVFTQVTVLLFYIQPGNVVFVVRMIFTQVIALLYLQISQKQGQGLRGGRERAGKGSYG